MRNIKSLFLLCLRFLCKNVSLENSAVATGLENVCSFQNQRRTMPKNVKTMVQLHSFHMLARLCSKSLKLGFSSMWTENFQMYKLGLEKSRAIRDQIVNIHWLTEKAREFQKNIYFCFIDYAKAFDCVDHNTLWKILKRNGKIRPLYLSPEKPVCQLKNSN